MVIVSARLTRRWRLSYRHDIDDRCHRASPHSRAWGVRSSRLPKASVHIHGVPNGRGIGCEDAANNNAVPEHSIIVIASLAGRA